MTFEYRVARTLLQVPGVRYTTHADAAAAEREVAELRDAYGGEEGFDVWIEERSVTPWQRTWQRAITDEPRWSPLDAALDRGNVLAATLTEALSLLDKAARHPIPERVIARWKAILRDYR